MPKLALFCEGKRDAKFYEFLLKKDQNTALLPMDELQRKVNLQEPTVAIVDCEGVSKLYDMVTRFSRQLLAISRPIPIMVVIDEDRMSINELSERIKNFYLTPSKAHNIIPHVDVTGQSISVADKKSQNSVKILVGATPVNLETQIAKVLKEKFLIDVTLSPKEVIHLTAIREFNGNEEELIKFVVDDLAHEVWLSEIVRMVGELV
ncbi:MAG: hypothetical protein RMI43_07385 [Candidatus Caldarchaeum sp.]|nr:hypothetical protein [Candidatus Caldarchaeum sp.]